jgi:Na+-translocating ferredoxin:NAD+ oxidoreductase RnfC subunit
VARGQLLADIPDGKLGARVHASMAGQVKEITDALIIIEA